MPDQRRCYQVEDENTKDISNIGFVNGLSWTDHLKELLPPLHKRHRTTFIFVSDKVFMLHDCMTGRDSGLCFLSRPFPRLCLALSCPGLPSPPLCCAPQSGSSGMWWPQTGQSPAFMAPRPTLEVCDWEPWSQSRWGGGWVAWVHPPLRLSCQTRVGHPCATTWLPAAHLYLLRFIFFTAWTHVVDTADASHG